MTQRLSNTQSAGGVLQFDAQGGLFGGDGTSLTWDTFLGIGGERPVTADVRLGGPLNVWLPFVGDTEILRLELAGQIATRMGLDINLEINPGQTKVSMPYNIDYRYPDAATLAANPFFRLEGIGTYEDSADAGLETDWPYFVFTIDAIFELAVLMNLIAGVLGNNGTYKLLDFDVGVDIPIVDLDSRGEDNPVFFGLEFTDTIGDDIGLSAGAYVKEDGDPDEITLPTKFEVSLSGSDIEITADEAEKETDEKDPKGKKKEDTDEDVKAEDDKKKDSLLDQVDISAGDLATLTLQIPEIELADAGDTGTRSLDDTVTYKDGTRTGDSDGTDESVTQVGFVQDLALLELDLDDIAVEAIKRALTGGVGVPNTPGLEGTIALDLDAGPFGAGASFAYNLLDADLEFSLPINQTVEATPEKIQTALSFYKANGDGEVKLDDDGAKEATWMEARLPRFSVYFNEANTFWDEEVAAGLRDAMRTNSRAAEDIGRFVDFSSGRIPGAFTGQTGSVSGGVERRVDGGVWEQLTTNPEETEWLARSRPEPGGDPQLSDLTPRDDAEFRYVIYNQQGADQYYDLDFSDLVGPDGIFEARLDVVTAPISSTGMIEGVPSIDLFFPDLGGDSIWTEVTHRAAAEVHNDTSLDFNIDFVLTALELQLGAYVRAFGAQFGLDFSFGPLWEKSFPLFKAELTKLYDDSYTLEENAFTLDGADEAQEAWGFAIGAGGTETVFDAAGDETANLFDGTAFGRGDSIDGGAARDTLSFVREEEARIVDLRDGFVSSPGSALRMASDPDTSVRATNRILTGETYDGGLLELFGNFAISWDLIGEDRAASDAANINQMRLWVIAVDGSPAFSIDISDFPAAEGEVIYYTLAIYGQFSNSYYEVFASTDPSQQGTRITSGTYDFSTIDEGDGVRIALVSDTPFQFNNKNHTIHEFDIGGVDLATRLGNGSVLLEGDVSQIDGIPIYGIDNIENATGGRGADQIFGNGLANILEGGEGDDTLDGRFGPDTLIGGVGADILITGGHSSSTARTEAFGGEGNDRIVAGTGAALLDGGENAPVGTSGQQPVDLDIVDYREAPGGLLLNLETGETGGPWIADHTLVNIEGIAGSAFNDTLTGDSGRSYFEAGDGNDILRGDHVPGGLNRDQLDALEGGNDRLYGQGGDDMLYADPGADMLDGGEGNDTVNYSEAPTSVFVDLQDGITIDGTEFAPLLQGTGSEDIDFWRIDGRAWRGWAQGDKFRDVENVVGTRYEDILMGDVGANLLGGFGGDDRLTGRGGQDTLRGHAGDDIFWTASSGLQVGLTYNPEDDDLSDAKHDDYSLRNSTTLDTSLLGGDIDRIEGGLGNDLQILDWAEFSETNSTNGLRLELIQNNILHEVYDDGSTAEIDYRLAYSAFVDKDEARLIGDLSTNTAGIEIAPFEIPGYNFLLESLSREGGAFEPLNDLGSDPAEVFEIIYYDYGGDFPAVATIEGGAGTFFRHTVNGLEVNETTFVPIANMASIEGLIGTEYEDILLGSAGGDSLYGAGGSDIINAGAGNDTVSFGYGQAPEALFSFPGRSRSDITAFSAAAVEEGAAGDLSTNNDMAIAAGETETTTTTTTTGTNTTRTFSQATGTFKFDTFNPTTSTSTTTVEYPDFTFIPIRFDLYANQIGAYITGPRDREALEALRTSLAETPDPDNGRGTDSSDFADFAMIDGGAGTMDTLDLRFDRGIGFLPEKHDAGAHIYLNELYGEMIGARALVIGVENIVGTDRNDLLVGSTLDNIIEGGEGADTMQGGGGIDTLSFANSEAGVDAVMMRSASGAMRAYDAGFDDQFTGFEILRGSELADRVGFVSRGVAQGPDITDNTLQLIDAGAGDDRIFAAARGVTYDGGDGDDLFFVPDAGRADGTGDITLMGGAGTDTLVMDRATLSGLMQDGDDWLAEVADPNSTDTMTLRLSGIEFIDLGDTELSLVNLDPTGPITRTLTRREDPWSNTRVFDNDDASRLTTTGGTVTEVPDTGAFQIRPGGTGNFAPVAVGDVLTTAELETMRFVPGAGFGAPVGLDLRDDDDVNARDTTRQDATLIIEVTLSDGTRQPREISIYPGDLDGTSLNLARPEDTDLAPVSYDIGALVEAEEHAGDVVHLSRLGQPDTAAVQSQTSEERELRVRSELLLEDATEDAAEKEQAFLDAEADLALAEQELASAIALNDEGATNDDEVLQAQQDLDIAEQAYDEARADFLNARAVQAQRTEQRDAAVLAEAQATDIAEQMFGDQLKHALPESRLGDAQAHEITEISDGGILWLTDSTPAPGPLGDAQTWTNVKTLHVGDVVTRAQLDLLAFEAATGLIDGDDAVSFRAVEMLEAQVTGVPDSGVVFSPVVELNLSAEAFDSTEGLLELTGVPRDGQLFYRDAEGERVLVNPGDQLTIAQIEALHFDSEKDRIASVTDEADRVADQTDQNRPSIGDGVDGEGAAPLPANPTLLELSFAEVTAAPVFDGVTIDLQAVGETSVLPIGDAGETETFQFNYAMRANTGWQQWALEDGGTGHFYAFQRLTESFFFGSPDVAANAKSTVDEYVDNWNQRVSGSADGPIHLASVGSAAENDFIYSVFADEALATRGFSGPRLGATRDGDTWVWEDGTPWDVTVWREGEPNNAGGNENTLHYAVMPADDTVPEEDWIYLPQWNDVRESFDTPGYILEVKTLATDRADLLKGSENDDDMRGGAGNDSLSGLAGDDMLDGGTGDDTLRGGAGDDTLTGGLGRDVFAMDRKGGRDVVTDFYFGDDRIDVSGLSLNLLSEIRVEQVGDDVLLHAKESVLVLQGVAADGFDATLTTEDFTGYDIRVSTLMPTPQELALQAGDMLALDEIARLRYRAEDDANGTMGAFEYRVIDPWHSAEALALMPDAKNGATDGRTTINLTPVNDAPRGQDRAYLVSIGGELDATAPELRLTGDDPEGDAVTVSLVEGPRQGTLTLNPNGAFVYRPRDGFIGDESVAADDWFTYSVSDGQSSNTYSVSLDVQDTSAIRYAPPGAGYNDNGFRENGGLMTDDTLGGHNGRDHIDATFGDDWIIGMAGNDSLEAGAGHDSVNGGSGNDTILGEDGNDTVTGGDGKDLVRLGDGDDRFNDNAQGGEFGQDTVFGGNGRDTIGGGNGDDAFHGEGGNDEILARLGNDRVWGGDGADTLYGNQGDDTIVGGNGRDLVWLGDGNDVFFDNGQGGQFGQDTVYGGRGNDTIEGGNGDDLFLGEDGQDSILGRLGNDRIFGGAGFDTLLGGDGDDTVVGGDGRDLVTLGTGNDQFFDNAQTGSSAHDTVFGGDGNDTIIGGGGDEELHGEAGADSIVGGVGNDALFGGDSADTLTGGDGNDSVTGGNGLDLVFLGAGDDTFFDNAQIGAFASDTVRAGTGNDTVQGGGGDDVFWGDAGDDLIYGRLGADVLNGGSGFDTMLAGDGADTVTGADGRDRAELGGGNDLWIDNTQIGNGQDLVFGGAGNDTINFGGGNDTATGGIGADTFVFADAINNDTLTDYDIGTDALEIAAALWGGPLTQFRLNALSDTSSGTLVLEFGGGHSITFDGLTSNAGLLDDITLV